MKVFTKCTECQHVISFWTWSSDRVGLKMTHGDKIKLKCDTCKSTNDYSVDNLKAKRSKFALLIAAAIFIIGTPLALILLWDYIWQTGLYGAIGLTLIIGVPSIIYGIINKNDNQRVMIFNRS